MNRALAPGLTHVQSLAMQDSLIVSALSPDSPGPSPAFSTAFLSGLVEWTCIEALKPYLQGDEYTKGTHIYISHGDCAVVSSKITAIAELIEIKGVTLRFRVDCFDECDQIGSCYHERELVVPIRAQKVAPGPDARFRAFRSGI
jgi:fluoroacetyl-CoA thioesterase